MKLLKKMVLGLAIVVTIAPTADAGLLGRIFKRSRSIVHHCVGRSHHTKMPFAGMLQHGGNCKTGHCHKPAEGKPAAVEP